MALTCGSPLQIIPTRSGFCSRAGTIPNGRALVTSTHATRRGRLRYEVITHYYDATFLTFGPVERVFCASAFQGRLSSCFEWDWIGHPVSRSNGVLMIPTYNDGGFRHNDGVFTFLLILSLDTAFPGCTAQILPHALSVNSRSFTVSYKKRIQYDGQYRRSLAFNSLLFYQPYSGETSSRNDSRSTPQESDKRALCFRVSTAILNPMTSADTPQSLHGRFR